MDDNLKRLAGLADMIKEAELAKLNAAQRKLRDAQDQIRKLQDARIEALGRDEFDTARRAGADQTWFRWAEMRIQSMNIEIAQAAANAETRKISARKAFGRASVLQQLAGRKPG